MKKHLLIEPKALPKMKVPDYHEQAVVNLLQKKPPTHTKVFRETSIDSKEAVDERKSSIQKLLLNEKKTIDIPITIRRPVR